MAFPDATFPTSLDTINPIGPNDQVPNPQGQAHSAIHTQLANILAVIQTVIGITGSSDPASIMYRLTGFNAAVVPLVDAATIATNAALGAIGDVTVAASRNMGAPTNPTNGQKFVWRITQGGAGSNLITWDAAAFDFGASGAPTLSTAVGSVDLVGGIYNSVKLKWQMVPASLGYT